MHWATQTPLKNVFSIGAEIVYLSGAPEFKPGF
jgi:hypothetical protein